MRNLDCTKSIIIVIASIFGLTLIGVSFKNRVMLDEKRSSCKEQYGLFLFNTSCSFYHYGIEIIDSVTIAAPSVGFCYYYEEIFNDELDELELVHGIGSEETMVDSAKLAAIKQEMAKINAFQNPFLTSMYADTWAGVLLCGKRRVVFILSEHTDDDIGKLVRELIELSPPPITLYNYGNWPAPEY